MNLPLAFIGGISTNELLILGFIALLLFGTRLPTIARSFGQSVTEFKKGMKEIKDDVEADVDVKDSKESKDSKDSTDSRKKDEE